MAAEPGVNRSEARQQPIGIRGNQKSRRINQKVLARQPLRQGLHHGCRFSVIGMITLNALHHDWLTTASAPSARRLWRAWTTQHPALAEHPGPGEAIASTRDKAHCPAPVLNAFIALSAEHTLARYGIVDAFIPWMGRHLATHVVPTRERSDQMSVLIAGFLEAAVTLAPTAPHDWPSTALVHAAEGPIRHYYRRLGDIPQPLGDPTDLDRTTLPVVTIKPSATHRLSGDELVIAELSNGVADKTITLEDANLLARVVIGGRTAQEQAPGLFIAERTAQWRVRKLAHRLAERVAA